MSTTSLPAPGAAEPAEAPARRPPLTEGLLDNLSMWTVVAATIALLYLVWATLEVLSIYVGSMPKVAP